MSTDDLNGGTQRNSRCAALNPRLHASAIALPQPFRSVIVNAKIIDIGPRRSRAEPQIRQITETTRLLSGIAGEPTVRINASAVERRREPGTMATGARFQATEP